MPVLSFDLLWRDRGASAGMQNLAKHTERTTQSFRALKVGAGLALVAAAGAAVKFGTSSVKAYVEAQTAQVKLQDAFAKFPKLADTNIGSLRKLNTQLALKTKFDDDATASGQAVLAQFGLTGQQLTKLTPLLQDYAAKTGKDLPAAAGVLGKAFLGNTRALKAIGIDYKMTGDKGKDFANIQRLVNEKVGGFAEKEGKSAAGQAAILRNQFGELQESAGKQLLPALLKVGQGLLRLVGFVQDNSAIFGTFGKTVKTIFSSIAESIGLGKVSFKSFSDFISTHQADITSGIIAGGKAFIGFGKILATVAKVGLQAFAFLADSQANMLEQMLGGFGLITHGAALAFGWIPGVGANFKRADTAFRGFAAGAVGGLRGAAAGARSLADGVDKKLLPGLNKAGQSLDALGKKEIASARNRDIMARAEIGHRRAIDAATAAAKANGKTLDANTAKGRDNRTALNNLVASSRNYISKLDATGASSKRVTSATATARAEFVRVARSMGVSRDRARELADRYFKIPPKRETRITQPGMVDSLGHTKTYNTRVGNIPGKKSTTVSVKFGSSGSVQLHVAGTKYIANATGGVLPGFTPGRDIYRFKSTAPGVPDLALGGGEAIMRPEWTRAVGGPKAVARMNRDATQGKAVGFAGGGTVPSMSRATTGAYRVGVEAGSAVARLAAAAVVKAAKAALQKQAAAAGGLIGGGAGGGRGLVRYHGGTFSALFRNNLIRAENAAGVHPPIYQGGWKGHGGGSRVGASGSTHDGDAVDYPQNRSLLRAFRRLVGAMWFRGPPLFVRHMHGVPAPGRGYGSPQARWQYQDYRRGGNGLAQGGVVKGGRGGVMARVGEGRRDELVAPLPRNWENLVRVIGQGGGTVVHNHYTINAPHYVGPERELIRVLVDADRRGQLAVIKR